MSGLICMLMFPEPSSLFLIGVVLMVSGWLVRKNDQKPLR